MQYDFVSAEKQLWWHLPLNSSSGFCGRCGNALWENEGKTETSGLCFYAAVVSSKPKQSVYEPAYSLFIYYYSYLLIIYLLIQMGGQCKSAG